MRCVKQQLSGWGRYPKSEGSLWRPERYRQLQINSSALIARGLGRSYGDAALNSGKDILLFEKLNRFLDFDEEKGILRAEGGVSLEEILEALVPRGWFLPVTPGTKFATLGGCIAADVHGKNHHRDGAFSRYVQEFELLIADGTTKRCSKEVESDLFSATVGGMGLTGIITEVTLQLKRIETAYMEVTYHPSANLEETLALLSNKGIDDDYSVAWIDCLATGSKFGRSIVMNAHHAPLNQAIKKPLQPPKRRQHTLPFSLPSFALNRWTIKAFNDAYYTFQSKKTAPFLQDYDSYFYPLDAIKDWNLMYGKKGFVQYQCVIPDSKETHLALRTLLSEISSSQRASFLAVLKRFGENGEGHLSFPMSGYTLALDIPVRDAALLSFLDDLDELVVHYGGRCYLAKDARMSPATFRKMYPRFGLWQQIKKSVDPKGKFQSDLSRRLRMEASL